MQKLISNTTLLTKLDISHSSLAREIKEGHFPQAESIGGKLYFKIAEIDQSLTAKAGRPVSIMNDRLFASKSLKKLFNKSHVWVWQKFIKNKDRRVKAIKIRSRLFFLESDIYADKELVKFLKVVSKEVA